MSQKKVVEMAEELIKENLKSINHRLIYVKQYEEIFKKLGLKEEEINCLLKEKLVPLQI